jgi:micrococcal nuclease
MNARRILYTVALACALLATAAAHLALSPPHASTPTPVFIAAAESTTTPDTYKVVKVVDGDTDDVLIDGKVVRLRLEGMDTPEVVDTRKPVQCFGREASAEGHKLLDGTWVRLAYDAVSGKTDIYGRTLAYVYLPDGTMYNEFMIRNGYAHEYDYQNQKYEYRAQFQADQAAAKKEQLGFWSPQTCDGNTTKPATAT